MIISSPAFGNNASIPIKYTCDGENINPPIEISEVPENARSLVLVMDDPDAPGGTWIHWTVWDIDPKTAMIDENSVPEGASEGVTSSGRSSYGGPCPPRGTHRYFFKLYALDAKIDLSSEADIDDLMKAIKGSVLDQAELVGLYKRQ